MTALGNCRWQVVALLATSMVSCREGTAAPDIAATRNPAKTPPAKAAGAGQSQDTKGNGAAKPPVPATEAIPVDELIAFIATKALYPIPFETAAHRFSPLVELHKEARTPVDMLLVGSRPGLGRIEISYIEGESGGWEFGQLALMLATPATTDFPALFNQVKATVSKKLGKPLFTKAGDAPLPVIGWKLGKRMQLWLTEETNTLPDAKTPDRHIRISVSEPGGEGG